MPQDSRFLYNITHSITFDNGWKESHFHHSKATRVDSLGAKQHHRDLGAARRSPTICAEPKKRLNQLPGG
jgi:hypothetical protein